MDQLHRARRLHLPAALRYKRPLVELLWLLARHDVWRDADGHLLLNVQLLVLQRRLQVLQNPAYALKRWRDARPRTNPVWPVW